MILLGIGIIIGILVRDIKLAAVTQVEEIKENVQSRGEAKFFEPVSVKESFDKSDQIDQFINNLK